MMRTMIRTKKCSKCKEIKPISEFNRDRQKRDGLCYYCKECQNIRNKLYRQKNAEKISKYQKQYHQKNKKYINERNRKYTKEWYRKNAEVRREFARKRYKNNIEKEKTRRMKYRETHLEYFKQYNKQWKKDNPNYEKEWLRNKRENNPWFRISKNISRQIRKSINKNKDGYHWEKLLGYTLQDLINHLERQFKIGMTWDNYGEWHIDHIQPVSSFNFKLYKDKEFKECWSLNNLQPLWAEENIRKSNKILSEVV